jgi:hypothetical protein
MSRRTSMACMMKIRESYPELADLPLRSPETSLILAVVNRTGRAEAGESSHNSSLTNFIARATTEVLRSLREFIGHDLCHERAGTPD